jgi:hypothetical protein
METYRTLSPKGRSTMKRKLKTNLSLKKEHLRTLTPLEIAEVVGGQMRCVWTCDGTGPWGGGE